MNIGGPQDDRMDGLLRRQDQYTSRIYILPPGLKHLFNLLSLKEVKLPENVMGGSDKLYKQTLQDIVDCMQSIFIVEWPEQHTNVSFFKDIRF